jgi:serine/threonine protein kinase
MGEIYRARDPRLGREVAIEGLSAEFSADPERLARFDREAKVFASLSHPNIGAIYGLEESPDGARYLVLELLEGETLAHRLARGPLSVRDTLEVGTQIADRARHALFREVKIESGIPRPGGYAP